MFENVKLIQFFLTIPSTSIATERSYSTKLNNNSLMPIDKQIFIYKKKKLYEKTEEFIIKLDLKFMLK